MHQTEKKNRSCYCSGNIILSNPLKIYLNQQQSQPQKSYCLTFPVSDYKIANTLTQYTNKNEEQNVYELKQKSFTLSNQLHSAVAKLTKKISKLIANNNQFDAVIENLTIVPANSNYRIKTKSSCVRLAIILQKFEGYHSITKGEKATEILKLQSQYYIQWIAFKGSQLVLQTQVAKGNCIILLYHLKAFDEQCKTVKINPNAKFVDQIKEVQADQTCAYFCETFYTNGGLKDIQQKDGLKLLQNEDLEVWISAQHNGCKNIRLKMLFDEDNLQGLVLPESQKPEQQKRKNGRKIKGAKVQSQSEDSEDQDQEETTYLFSGPPCEVFRIQNEPSYVSGEEAQVNFRQQFLDSKHRQEHSEVYFLNDQNRNSKYVYGQFSICNENRQRLRIRKNYCMLMILFEK